MNNSIEEVSQKPMFIDLKEGCIECGMPVGIYLLNYDQGLKMCSNNMCEWPLSEEFLQIYNFHNVEFKGINRDGPCANVDLEEINKLSTHMRGLSPKRKTCSASKIKKSKPTNVVEEKGSEKHQNDKNILLQTFSQINNPEHIEEDIEGKEINEESSNIEQESETEEATEETLNKERDKGVNENDEDNETMKKLELEDELHIDECLAKVKAKLVSINASNKNKTNITNPWMLRQLQINQIHGGKRKIKTCEQIKLQKRIHVKVNNEPVTGPAITIQFDDIEPTVVSNTTSEMLLSNK